jgi:cellulose biosynthesis protein BcsQ
MYRTCVAAHKGRVGKTTGGTNRAAEPAGVPHVLMVGPDPQAGWTPPSALTLASWRCLSMPG